MKLHLYLPDTTEYIANISQDSAMLRLFAYGKLNWLAMPLDEALCRLFGIKKQQDWPWAALAWLGQYHHAPQVGTKAATERPYYLFASPVNLALMRDSFLLNAPVPQPLSAEHEQALRLILNQYFAEDKLEFYPAPGGHWYLRLPASVALATTSPYIAQGQNIADFMPQGAEALRWRTRLNEVQMLLHGHAVNHAREAQGDLPINSIWLHGGGVMPEAGLTHFPMQVYADDASVQGLALLAGVTPLALTDFAYVLDQHEDALLFYPLQQWHPDMSALLLKALRNRKLQELILHFAWQGRILQLVLRPRDLWKFWRKPQEMEVYF